MGTGGVSAAIGLGNLAVQLGLDSSESEAFEGKLKTLERREADFKIRFQQLLNAVIAEMSDGDDVDHCLATLLGHVSSASSNAYTLNSAIPNIATNVQLLKNISEVEVFQGARIVTQSVGKAGNALTGLGIAFGAIGLVLGIQQAISGACDAKLGSSRCADIMD